MQYLICQSIWHFDTFPKVHEVLWTSVHLAWQNIDQGTQKPVVMGSRTAAAWVQCTPQPEGQPDIQHPICPLCFCGMQQWGTVWLASRHWHPAEEWWATWQLLWVRWVGWPVGTTKWEPSFPPLLSSQAYIKPVEIGISNSLGLYAK